MKHLGVILTVVAFAFSLSASAVFAQPCEGDLDYDQDVDGTDAKVFKEDFGRSPFSESCPPYNPCPYGMIDCGTKCVDPLTDNDFCGVGSTCLGGAVCGVEEICDSGTCVLICPTGLSNCGGTCVDTNTDENYCGSCTISCSIAEMCISGNCEIVRDVIYQAAVPKTGQTTSYDTGDDGDLEKGVEWPNPRFTDNGDGTITDGLTGLIWLKDANCFGLRFWWSALSDSNGLEDGECGLTDGSSAGDWRMPNLFELESLRDMRNYDPALPSGHPFTNLQSNWYYWSSTTYVDGTDGKWFMSMINGHVGQALKDTHHYFLPVRDPL